MKKNENPPGEKNFGEDDVSRLGALLYDHLQDQIALADTKAHLILAANAVLAAAMTGLSKGMILKLFAQHTPFLVRVSAFFTLLMFFSLVLSFYYVLRVTRPILKVSEADMKNLFYFGGIRNYELDEFIKAFQEQSPEKVKDEILIQVYAKANIAYRKFCKVRSSMNFLLLALMLWGTTYLLLAFVPD